MKRIKCKLVIKVTSRKTATKIKIKISKEYLTLLVNGVRREKVQLIRSDEFPN